MVLATVGSANPVGVDGVLLGFSAVSCETDGRFEISELQGTVKVSTMLVVMPERVSVDVIVCGILH